MIDETRIEKIERDVKELKDLHSDPHRLLPFRKDSFQLKFPLDPISKKIINGVVSSSGFSARCYLSANQSVTSSPETIQFNTETFNDGTDVSFTSASYGYTIKVAKKYRVWVVVHLQDIATDEFVNALIIVNRTIVSRGRAHTSNTTDCSSIAFDKLNLSLNDVVTAKVSFSGTATAVGGSSLTYMVIE